jgi:exopolysaccharide production protein ExoZ
MKRNKLLGLQILRGLAAFMVVIHHINQTYFHWNPPIDFLEIFNYGSFGVDIFFVLSGFIMYYSVKYNKRGGFSFFIDRFFRIFPVYWLLTILLIISSIILPIKSYDTFFTWDTLLKSLFLVPNQNPSGIGHYPFLYVGWTLTYEMFFYSILSISLIINKKYALIIASIFLSILPIGLKNISLLGHSNFLLYEFVFGILIAYVYTSVQSSKYSRIVIKPINALPFLIVLIIYNYLAIKHFGFAFKVKLSMAGSIILIFLILEDIIKKTPRLGGMVILGDISYSTYLIHPIILGWFKLIFKTSNSDILKFSIILLFLFLVYLLSRLSYRYIEVNKHLAVLKEKVKDHILI